MPVNVMGHHRAEATNYCNCFLESNHGDFKWLRIQPTPVLMVLDILLENRWVIICFFYKIMLTCTVQIIRVSSNGCLHQQIAGISVKRFVHLILYINTAESLC